MRFPLSAACSSRSWYRAFSLCVLPRSPRSTATRFRLTRSSEMFSMLRCSRQPPSLNPCPSHRCFPNSRRASSIIRFCEVGWMVHRLIPLIQPPVIMFAPEWASDWRIIDDSFKITVNVANQKPWQAGWRGCLRVRVRQISLHRCINFPHALSGPVGSASRTSLMVSITPPIS
jgi:hypothetical protein